MDHEGSGYARYGNGSSVGRRQPDEFSKKVTPMTVSKRVRNKDAEDDRQRRLGAGIAATGLGSALLLRRGLGGALNTTRKLRKTEVGAQAWKKTDDSVKTLINHTDIAGRPVRGKGVAMSRRQLGESAGGAALGGGSIALGNHARSRRNHRWE